MTWIDDELRDLLRRKDPPEGFAERVLARLEAPPRRLAQPNRYRRTLPLASWAGWVAIAAACLLLAVVFAQHRQEQRRRVEANLASEQAAVGLHIASVQLNSALQQAREGMEQALP